MPGFLGGGASISSGYTRTESYCSDAVVIWYDNDLRVCLTSIVTVVFRSCYASRVHVCSGPVRVRLLVGLVVLWYRSTGQTGSLSIPDSIPAT